MAGRWAVRRAMGRRMATGIDVAAGDVRVVVVSRRRRGTDVRVEGIDTESLGQPDGPDEVRWAAVGRALSAAVSRLSARGVRCDVSGVMALRDDEMRTATLDLAGRDDIPDAARQAAERISGLAPDSLAFDWRPAGGARPGEIAIAAAPQAALQWRIEAAAAAGVDLTTVDCEPIAALRALRFAALHEPLDEPCFALWFADAGVRGWRLERGAAVLQFAFPDRAHATLADALRAFARRPARCMVVGGDARCVARFGTSVAEVGDLLGAIVLPFECAPWADGDPVARSGSPGGPAFAVAFGLALRGVWQ
ncbi:competence protein ComA [Burkholderia sp. SRS-46]|nr:competence protein ComA [Burkholderia sp. SRS-46]